MAKIIWLASYPKSGNTWLRIFLHNYITNATTPHSINHLADFSASENNAAFYNKYDSNPASTFTTEQVQALRPRVHQSLTQLHNDLVFVKTHNAALNIHNIPLCTPEHTAGAIYIIRDPRDVAISYARYLGLTIDATIAFMAKPGAANRGTDEQVFEYLSTWSNHVDSWTKTPNTLILRYEDLLSAPEQNFGKLIAFLGTGDPDPDRLQRAITASNFATLSQQEATHGYTAAGPNTASPFFRTGRAGQWHNGLTAPQIQRIELDHGGIMRRFGYLF